MPFEEIFQLIDFFFLCISGFEICFCVFVQENRTTLQTKIVLLESIRKDKGNYTLMAENCYGKAQHVIRVEVLGNKASSASAWMCLVKRRD